MNINDGWVDDARRCPSPNYNERPDKQAPSLLVIHNISLPPGNYGGGNIEAFFRNQLDPSGHPYFEEIKDLQVSAHFLIARDGELTQFVSCLDRAWHAGVSSYCGREQCNDFSIGIELEGQDDEVYTDEQYSTLASLTRKIMLEYPDIDAQSIVGHCDIAPDRKTDPGEAFEWLRYKSAIR